jgi:putrescine---pyruvate transaminase
MRLKDHPLVGEVCKLGLIGAVEIVRDICIKNGLMVRGIRDSIVLCPSLIITEAQIDELVDII